jgi:outer membrane protein assembly factor BamB
MMARSKTIYLGIKGSVLALDPATGNQLWATHLKGSDFVHVVLDGDHLYAATHGEIFCLDPKTGEGRWHNPLKGFGWGLVSIATENSAENTLLTVLAEKRRQEAQARAASSAGAAS